ncbi:MAG: redox-sensitive transcriptional activator SoxR, partial [Pseudomonadota bacterium]
MAGKRPISIGKLAERTGIAVSAIRFYEDKGLIRSIRNRGGHRRFLQADIRRVSFILIAQRLGFSLADIADQLATLPDGRNPTKADWDRISRRFGTVLDQRIAESTGQTPAELVALDEPYFRALEREHLEHILAEDDAHPVRVIV